MAPPDGLSRISFPDDQFFHLPSQGSVYGMTRISGIIGENDKIMVISSSRRKVFAIDFNRSRRGIKFSSMREIQFTYLPPSSEIVAIDGFNKSESTNDFVVALTVIRVAEEQESQKHDPTPPGDPNQQSQHLNIYSDWEPNSANTLEIVAQSCMTIPLYFTPYMLRHVKSVFPVSSIGRRSKQPQCEVGWLLSGSDCKVHLYLEDRPNASYYEANVSKLFPELEDFSSVVLWVDVVYLENNTRRLTAVGCECGFVGFYVVDTWQPVVSRSWSVQHDGPVVSTIIWRDSTVEVESELKVFGDQAGDEETDDYHLLVANSLQPSCVYKDVVRSGFDRECVLPKSYGFDCVMCACVGDFNMDGCNEVALGTYGQEVLVYCEKPHDSESDSSDGTDSDGASASSGDFELVFQKSFAYPILALDYADITGDGMKELIVLTSRGVSIVQHDFDDVMELLKSRV